MVNFKRFAQSFVLTKYYRYARTNEKLQILKVAAYTHFFVSIFLFFLLIALGGTFVYYLYFPISTFQTTLSEDVKIDVSELSPSQQEKAYEVIKGSKPIYYNVQKKIVFVKDLNKKFPEEEKSLAGINSNKGNIYIKYNGNVAVMKKVLCHEMLHTFMFSGESTHPIIYDLANVYPCFENKRTTIEFEQ